MLIHFLDSFSCDFPRGPFITPERSLAVSHGGRYAAQRHHGSHATNGIRASTKAKEEHSITRLPHLQNRGVTVDNVQRYAEPCRLAHDVMNPAVCTLGGKDPCVRLGAQAGVVKRKLHSRINLGFRTAACCSEELVNVADVFIRRQSPRLACSIRKDQYVFGHSTPNPRDAGRGQLVRSPRSHPRFIYRIRVIQHSHRRCRPRMPILPRKQGKRSRFELLRPLDGQS